MAERSMISQRKATEEERLAKAAYAKLINGQPLSSSERRALARFERQQEETRRWEYYRSIPQKHWREMSGRSAQILNDQAARYGIPVGGPGICLPDVARALHDFLATHAHLLSSAHEQDVSQKAANKALLRLRLARASLAELEVQERRGEFLHVNLLVEFMRRLFDRLHTASALLHREYGPDAAEIVNEIFDTIRAEIERLFDLDLEQHAREANGSA